MQAQRIDGILFLPCGPSADASPSFVKGRTSLVRLDRRLTDGDSDLAVVDNLKGAFLALHHLNEFGHERIALVAGHGLTVKSGRIDSFQRSLVILGIKELPKYMRRGGSASRNSGYDEKIALRDLSDPRTAIFVTDQLMMLGATTALRDRGMRVPDQMSLIGFDDPPFAGSLRPPITTIARPASELGTIAAKLPLDRVVHGYTGVGRTIILPPESRFRSSVGFV